MCRTVQSCLVMCGLSKYSKRPRGIKRWREGTDGGALATLQPLKRGGKLHAGNSQPMKAFAVINFKLHVQAQFTTHTSVVSRNPSDLSTGNSLTTAGHRNDPTDDCAITETMFSLRVSYYTQYITTVTSFLHKAIQTKNHRFQSSGSELPPGVQTIDVKNAKRCFSFYFLPPLEAGNT